MIQEPWFWRADAGLARIIAAGLTPLSAGYAFAGAMRRRLTTAQRAPIPVICVGNATLGGVGKTPFAIALCALLKDRGITPHFLSRGYGGRARGPLRVDTQNHSYADVGDEPLLLAGHAPTWVCRDRPAGARAAASAGADAVIMDDGFQNPTLFHDFSILLRGSKAQFGNGRVFPAGPLREPMEDAAARASCVVDITALDDTEERTGASHTAYLAPTGADLPDRAVAFCGIANPERFFALLEGQSVEIADRIAFPDHHPFTTREIDALLKQAKAQGVRLITTEKDWVRIDPAQRDEILVLPVEMRISNGKQLAEAICTAIADHGRTP